MGEEKPEKWVPKLVTEADVTVGAVLRRVRERSGWTLEQAGERSGISRSASTTTTRRSCAPRCRSFAHGLPVRTS